MEIQERKRAQVTSENHYPSLAAITTTTITGMMSSRHWSFSFCSVTRTILVTSCVTLDLTHWHADDLFSKLLTFNARVRCTIDIMVISCIKSIDECMRKVSRIIREKN